MAAVAGRLRGAGIGQKGVMDMENSVVIAGGKGIMGQKGNVKKYNKDEIKK